jgi:hypothetical protein
MPECRDMGLGTLGLKDTVFKQKFRWMLEIPGIVGDGINVLPPNAAGRPKLTFNDFQVNHLVEIITIPGRPVWNPITLTLYDIVANGKGSTNPIYDWILTLYGTGRNTLRPSGATNTVKYAGSSDNFPYKFASGFKQPVAYIKMYDGCGNELERWTLENVWPSEVDFGELDMGTSEAAMITLTLKYDRAYLELRGDT